MCNKSNNQLLLSCKYCFIYNILVDITWMTKLWTWL